MNDLDVVSAGEREDATLVLALRAGESWAPKAILDRYADRVSRFFARSAGRRPHDLEDLTQDVFLRVFACHAIQKPGSLRYFIMSVAARVLSRQIRYQQMRRSVCLSATGEVPEIATPPRADDDARYTLRRCFEILERIRTRERAAFVLRHLEGMSLEEVAGHLNVSTSTAKRLIRRAANKISTRVARARTAEIARTG
jgi:RNA polymerase sigma-70 factor (ECF subfamily)